MVKNNHGHRRQILTYLSLLLCFSQPSALSAFVGPKPCPSRPSTLGYTNTTILTADMIDLSNTLITNSSYPRQPEYLFVLCPKTTFDMGSNLSDTQNQKMRAIIPTVENTTIACGGFLGRREDECILRGGRVQLHLDDDLFLQNVTFRGLIFEGNEGYTVQALGFPKNRARFVDCEWRNNKDGRYLVLIWWDLSIKRQLRSGDSSTEDENKHNREEVRKSIVRPKELDQLLVLKQKKKSEDEEEEEKKQLVVKRRIQTEDTDKVIYLSSMTVVFESCTFTNNEVGSLILNDDGYLDLDGSSFLFNEAVSLITIVKGGAIALHRYTTFQNNVDKVGPVLIDADSHLLYHDETVSGSENAAGTNDCEGIYIENDDSDCLTRGKPCEGTCCTFGDHTCDLYPEPTPAPTAPLYGPSGNEFSHSTRNDGCDSKCLGLSLGVPIAVILFCFSGIWLRGLQNKEVVYGDENAMIDEEPVQPKAEFT